MVERTQTLDGFVPQLGREVRVAQRRLERLVSEDLLDRLERHTLHHEPRRARVSQVVEAEIRDARLLEQREPAGTNPAVRLA